MFLLLVFLFINKSQHKINKQIDTNTDKRTDQRKEQKKNKERIYLYRQDIIYEVRAMKKKVCAME